MTALSHAGSRGRLLPILGIGFGLAVTVGNAIGAGILRAPGEVAGHLPLVWLYMAVWVVGGLYALLGALQLAELGAMIPRSGGQYVFSRYALGEYPGFIVGWSDWISTAGTAAAVSIVIGEFSAALFPRSGASAVAIATSVVLIFAIAQWRGIRWGSAIQNVTNFLDMLDPETLLYTYVYGFYKAFSPDGTLIAVNSYYRSGGGGASETGTPILQIFPSDGSSGSLALVHADPFLDGTHHGGEGSA